MRLSLDQIDHIISSIMPFLNPHHAELRLYGSRANDKAKGGDIDLVLLTDQPDTAELLLEKSIIFWHP